MNIFLSKYLPISTSYMSSSERQVEEEANNSKFKMAGKVTAYVVATLLVVGAVYAGVAALSSAAPGHTFVANLFTKAGGAAAVKAGGITAIAVGGIDFVGGALNNFRTYKGNKNIWNRDRSLDKSIKDGYIRGELTVFESTESVSESVKSVSESVKSVSKKKPAKHKYYINNFGDGDKIRIIVGDDSNNNLILETTITTQDRGKIYSLNKFVSKSDPLTPPDEVRTGVKLILDEVYS